MINDGRHTHTEHIYLLYKRHHVTAWLQHNGEQNREHDLTDFFVAYFTCMVLVSDSPLTFLEFLIMQGSIIHIIILHVDITQQCLCWCISNRTVLK